MHQLSVTFGSEASESGQMYKQKPDGILRLGNSKGAFHVQVFTQHVICDGCK
jgi:hypothetical protein